MDPEVVSHYYVLNIEHDARDVQIKMAFRRQSLEWHPDKNPNVSDKKLFECNAMMQKLNDAYTCLRDPKARGIYELRCASIVFTHEDDPGNWFRKQFEAERKSREEAAQRRRKEEQERNAARQQERQEQERRRKEAEEREQRRREAEEREQQRRTENETREAEEQEKMEQQRRRNREQEQEEQSQGQKRPETQEQRSRTTDSKFTAQEWETFFNLLRILIVLQKLASEGSQTGPEGNSNHNTSDPSDFEETSEARRSTQEESSKNNFPAGSKPSNYPSKETKKSEFGPVPIHSSRVRWSDSELEALLKLRRDYPYEKWDTIASRLNAKFGNGRNGNAVRQKHSKHSH